MKKLIVIISVILSSCNKVDNEMIVKSAFFSRNINHKYIYELRSNKYNIYFYSNEKYNIGDTLVITKK